MKGLVRWIGIALATVIALAIVAFGVVYLLSERIDKRTYAVPVVAVSIPTDPAAINEGHRLATVHGCLDCNPDGRGLFSFGQSSPL